MARTRVMVDQAPAPRVGASIMPREEFIQQVADVFQENYDRTHEAYGPWQRTTRGGLTCENCFQILPRFLSECQQCVLA